MQKLEMDLECPQCGRSFEQRIEEMRPGRSRRCPGCHVEIRFTGDDGAEAQKAMDQFERELKKLNRSLGFRCESSHAPRPR